jgi:co-chaperonin GroES (HSP10)
MMRTFEVVKKSEAKKRFKGGIAGTSERREELQEGKIVGHRKECARSKD